MLEESVVYQDILQKGVQQGERNLALRLLARRFGKLPAKVRKQIERLSVEEIEQLGEALLDFKTKAELTAWLQPHVSGR